MASVAGVVIIYHVMTVQNNFDEAGIKFTKMDDGLLLSSVHSASSSSIPSSSMTVTEMAHLCAEKIRASGAEPDPTKVTDCVRTMLNELDK